MNRIFGQSKPAAPKPTLGDATASMEKRGDTLDQKIMKLDKELARYTDQMKKMKPGPAKTSVQKRALVEQWIPQQQGGSGSISQVSTGGHPFRLSATCETWAPRKTLL